MKMMTPELTLSWVGDFESLKEFVNMNLKLYGEWSSSGGDKKVFTYADGLTTISWRKSKKALIIESKEINRLKLKRCLLVCESVFEDEHALTEAVNHIENLSWSCRCNELSVDVEGAKLDVTIAGREIRHNTNSIQNIENRIKKNTPRN